MGWLWHALSIAGSMTWEILWALILGFALSAVVQAVVRRETVYLVLVVVEGRLCARVVVVELKELTE